MSVRLAGEIKNTSEGETLLQEKAWGWQFTALESGTLNELKIPLVAGTAHSLNVGIATNNAGVPGTLIGNIREVANEGGLGAGTLTFTGLNAPVVAGTKYFVVGVSASGNWRPWLTGGKTVTVKSKGGSTSLSQLLEKKEWKVETETQLSFEGLSQGVALTMSASSESAASVGLTARALLGSISGASASAAELAVTTHAAVAGTASSESAASASVTVPQRVTGTGASASSAGLTLSTAEQLLPVASSTSGASLVLSAPALLQPAAAAGASAAELAVTVPTLVPLAAASSSSGVEAPLTAATSIACAPAASVSAGSLVLTRTGRMSMVAESESGGALAMRVPAGLLVGAAGSSSTASADLRVVVAPQPTEILVVSRKGVSIEVVNRRRARITVVNRGAGRG